MHLFSPTGFESAYVLHERKIYAWLSSRSSGFGEAAAAIALCAFIFTVQTFLGKHRDLATDNLFYFLPYVARGIFLVVIGSVFFSLLEERKSNLILPYFCLALSFYSNYLLFSEQRLGRLFWPALFFTPTILILAGAYIWAKRLLNRGAVLFLGYTLAHFAWVATVLSLLYREGHFSTVAYLFGFKSILFWFWICARSRDGGLSLTELSNPINALRAWPWPKRSIDRVANDRVQRAETWWNGWFNILIGYTLFAISAGLLFRFPNGYQTLFFNYFVHILVDVGTLNLIAGGARVFGFNLMDATYFSFLAKSPGELWRRGSVYNFKFNQEFVFWPAIRALKNYWLALFLAFSMYYLNSLTFESLGVLTRTSAQPTAFHERLEFGRVLNFAFHFGLICLPGRIWNFRRLKISEARRQWLGVFAVHGCNLAVLYLAYFLIQGVLEVR